MELTEEDISLQQVVIRREIGRNLTARRFRPFAVVFPDADQRLLQGQATLHGENIRLVIWDLDETFWRGTLSESGIREYVAAHDEIVVCSP